MHLKLSSAKGRLFSLGLNELNYFSNQAFNWVCLYILITYQVQIWWMNSLCNSPDITTFCLRCDEFPFSLPLICRTFAVKWCIGLSSNLADDVVRSQSRLYFGQTPLNFCYLLAFYWWLYHRIHAIPKNIMLRWKLLVTSWNYKMKFNLVFWLCIQHIYLQTVSRFVEKPPMHKFIFVPWQEWPSMFFSVA